MCLCLALGGVGGGCISDRNSRDGVLPGIVIKVSCCGVIFAAAWWERGWGEEYMYMYCGIYLIKKGSGLEVRRKLSPTYSTWFELFFGCIVPGIAYVPNELRSE